jgi:serine/threonine protein kinase
MENSLYSLESKIGSGSSGDVYLAYLPKVGNDNGHRQKVAVKVIPKKCNSRSQILNEIGILELTKEMDGVVQLIESKEEEKSFQIIYKYAEGIDLVNFLDEDEGLSELRARAIFTQIVKVVEKLHGNDILHNDLKNDNIVVDPRTNSVMLIDFGSSERSEDGFTTSSCGSRVYICPEKLANHLRLYNPPKKIDGKKSEIWK